MLALAAKASAFTSSRPRCLCRMRWARRKAPSPHPSLARRGIASRHPAFGMLSTRLAQPFHQFQNQVHDGFRQTPLVAATGLDFPSREQRSNDEVAGLLCRRSGDDAPSSIRQSKSNSPNPSDATAWSMHAAKPIAPDRRDRLQMGTGGHRGARSRAVVPQRPTGKLIWLCCLRCLNACMRKGPGFL